MFILYALIFLVSFSFLMVMAAAFSVVYGITLSVLWGWFMVPTLHLPALSVPQAIGVSLVIGFLTHQDPPEAPEAPPAKTDEEKKERAVKATKLLFKPILRSLGVLATGWIVHHYFMS